MKRLFVAFGLVGVLTAGTSLPAQATEVHECSPCHCIRPVCEAISHEVWELVEKVHYIVVSAIGDPTV